MIETLEGCDERSLVLDGDHLSALRWGSERHRVALGDLSPGKLVRDDKGKIFGFLGEEEERLRTDFGGSEMAVWVPLERQQEAEAFLATVNEAINQAKA